MLNYGVVCARMLKYGFVVIDSSFNCLLGLASIGYIIWSQSRQGIPYIKSFCISNGVQILGGLGGSMLAPMDLCDSSISWKLD